MAYKHRNLGSAFNIHGCSLVCDLQVAPILKYVATNTLHPFFYNNVTIIIHRPPSKTYYKPIKLVKKTIILCQISKILYNLHFAPKMAINPINYLYFSTKTYNLYRKSNMNHFKTSICFLVLVNVLKNCIDLVGKLLFCEKKSVLFTRTAPFLPLCSFGHYRYTLIIFRCL